MFIRLTSLVLCVAAVAVAPLTRADALTERAQSLIEARRAGEALRLLEPYEGQRAGEAQFDYVLAVATLDAGDPAKATLVFERLLLLNPQFHGARIDLGRAYFQLERYSDAQGQFETALANKPPPRARQLVEDYLARIRLRTQKLRFSRFIDAHTRAGYDSNVNSATEINEFLGFELNPVSREQDSEFVEIGVAAGGAYRLRPTLMLDGRLRVQARHNPQASFADSDVLSGSLRLRQERDRQRRTVSLQAFALRLDGESNSRALTLSGDWQFQLSDSLWVGPTVRLGSVRYEDALKIKDVDQWALGAAASWRFGAQGQGSLQGLAMYGQDEPRVDGSRYARDFVRLFASMAWRFNDRVHGALSASVEDSGYDAIFFEQSFDKAREDLTYRGRGSVDWRFADRWRLNHSISYILNDTDVDIFQYERFELGLGVRYVWY